MAAKLRKIETGFEWWCLACRSRHFIPNEQIHTFNNNFDAPTFTPSFVHTENVRGGLRRCHYRLIAGRTYYEHDSIHEYAWRTIQMCDVADRLP